MTSLCFWIRMVLWYLRYRPIAQSSKERSAHHLCVHAHARPGRPAANPCEATVERSWLEVGREKSRKSAGKWLENSWKLGKLAGNWLMNFPSSRFQRLTGWIYWQSPSCDFSQNQGRTVCTE